MKGGRFGISLLLISASLLSLEISLMRILRYEGFGNFTYGSIALALTGFGATGTAVCLFRDRIAGRELLLCAWALLFFVLSLGSGFWLSARIPFDPLRIVWDGTQLLILALRLFLYALPFLTGSVSVILSFSLMPPGRAYFLNLTGSALGIPVLLASLSILPPERVLAVPLFTATAAFLVLVTTPRAGSSKILRFAAPILAAGGIALFLWGDISVLPFKGREVALTLPDARVLYTHQSPQGTVEVVGSRYIRIAPGLSSAFQGELPRQHGLYLDGDLLGAIDGGRGEEGDASRERKGPRPSAEYFRYQVQSIAYFLHDRPRVLISGLGGGAAVRRAYALGGSAVLVTESNPLLSRLLRDRFGSFTGGLFGRHDLGVYRGQVRAYLAKSGDTAFDIVDLSTAGTEGRSIGGIYASDTDYTLTVEAFGEYLDILGENGTVTVSLPLRQPPRALPKVVALARDALAQRGLSGSERIVVVRSWSHFTVLVQRDPFPPEVIARLREMTGRMFFDLVYYPGMEEGEGNRFTVVPGRPYEELTARILQGDEHAEKGYYFSIEAPTDDRPFFGYFFKPVRLPRLFREMGRKWLFVSEGGYIVLTATFAATVLLAALFIVLPPLLAGGSLGPRRGGILLYFSAIAIGYMFVEVLLMLEMSKYVGNPLVSNSAVIGLFLLSSGGGSYVSDRVGIDRARRLLAAGLGALTLLFMAQVLLPDTLIGPFLPPPGGAASSPAAGMSSGGGSSGGGLTPGIFVYTVLAAAPMGFFMGMFFPVGLSFVKRDRRIAWAWSVNGFFSVIASTGVVVVSSNIGIWKASLIPIACYWSAFLVLPSLAGRRAFPHARGRFPAGNAGRVLSPAGGAEAPDQDSG